MPEKVLQITYQFNRPWSFVCRAYLAKYPHPQLWHVESLDTLEQFVDESGRLITRRIMALSYLKFSSIFSYEQSIIDLKGKTIYLNSNNLSLRSFTRSNEIYRYSVNSDETTLYTLSYNIKVAFGLGLLIDPLVSTIRKNFDKGIQVLEEIMMTRFGSVNFSSYSNIKQKAS